MRQGTKYTVQQKALQQKHKYEYNMFANVKKKSSMFLKSIFFTAWASIINITLMALLVFTALLLVHG